MIVYLVCPWSIDANVFFVMNNFVKTYTKATQSVCRMELKEAMLTPFFLIFTLIVLQGLYALKSLRHFFLFHPRKIPLIPERVWSFAVG